MVDTCCKAADRRNKKKRDSVARLWRGVKRCCGKAKFSFACQKRTRKAPATFEAREARIKGCSPLIIPEELSKRKKAGRCAKTGCGAQRPLRALSGTRVLLTAAPTAPPCIRRRRRSSPLHFFSFLRFAAPQLIKAAAECGASLPSARGCWRQRPAQRPALRQAPRRCSCAA